MKNFKSSLKNEYLPIFFTSAFIGIIVGVIVGFFNFALRFLSSSSVSIYSFVQNNPLFMPLLFLGLVAFALFMNFIHKNIPAVRGGGMPQTIAMCKGQVKYKWYKVLWSNIVCSFSSFFCGLPVGAEGPSMFVGASAADGAHKTLKLRPYTKQYLVSAGASAGLSATFNAPLAGIIFTIEKVHRKFSPLLLFVVCIAVVFSTITINLISSFWGGAKTFFDFPFLADIPFEYFWMLVVTGLGIGLCAVGFQLLLVKTQKFLDTKTKHFPYWLRLLLAFVLTGVCGLLILDSLTGGHALIEKIANLDFAITALLILLAAKLFLITICYNSGATGGLFVPSLCIGALAGGIFGHLLLLCGLPSDFYSTIVCISMLSFLAGTTHAPISSLVLLIEITGFSGNLLAAGTTIIISFMVCLVLRRKSLYEEQVDRLVLNSGFNEDEKSLSKAFTISDNSILIDKRVSDVFLPQTVDISSIKRENKTIVSSAETRFKAGDEIKFIYQKNNKEEIEEYLNDIIN